MSKSHLLAVLILLAPGPSEAAESDRAAEARAFAPNVDGLGLLSVDRSDVLGTWQWSFAFVSHVASRPVQLDLSGLSGSMEYPADYSLVTHFQVAFGFCPFGELFLDVPFAKQWLGSPMDADTAGSFLAADPESNLKHWYQTVSAGDLRAGLKFRVLASHGFGLALVGGVVVPTGEELTFNGERGPSGFGWLVADYRWRMLGASLNLGYLARPETLVRDPGDGSVLLELDDEFLWGLGLSVSATRWLGFLLEATGRVPVLVDHDNRTGDRASDLPMELLAGVVFHPTRALKLTVAGSLGLAALAFADTPGRQPPWRVVIGLAYALRPSAARPRVGDTDGDGVPDAADGCPKDPEDQDGYEDADGCPEPDNDGDGVIDQLDKCPNLAEDPDAFQDADGCPDADNDGDGVLDDKDRCPNEAEDRDGYKDADGCPDADNDGDGIPDAKDSCPDEPGPATANGCPTGAAVPRVVGKKIEITEKITFQRGKARLTPQSVAVLAKIAALLKSNPHIRLVRIEGHTDSTGDPKRNLILSQHRAEAVRAKLIELGVEPRRLQAVGYGDTRPIAPNDTREGRAKNRRVEFVVVR